MTCRVVAFTDTYFPSINGVSYTVHQWRESWENRGRRMDVVYPRKSGYTPSEGEHPTRSLSFPFYDDFQLGLPLVPDSLPTADLVHLHGQFMVGLGGLRFARDVDAPIVATYHMSGSEYADYLSPIHSVARGIERVTNSYERWFFQKPDLVITPTEATRRHLREVIGVDTAIEVIPNGIQVDTFRPVDPSDFLARHDIPTDRPLVGYTGRQGYEKNLVELLEATRGLDVTLVFGGDGPANEELQAKAAEYDLDAHFLGFLEREELPAFYSSLDVFGFPSPIETQGLVAIEANACGTPVVGVDTGGLSNTIVDGKTGFHYEIGDVEGFRRAIQRAIDERDSLRTHCLAHGKSQSIDAAVDKLSDVYDRVLNGSA